MRTAAATETGNVRRVVWDDRWRGFGSRIPGQVDPGQGEDGDSVWNLMDLWSQGIEVPAADGISGRDAGTGLVSQQVLQQVHPIGIESGDTGCERWILSKGGKVVRGVLLVTRDPRPELL